MKKLLTLMLGVIVALSTFGQQRTRAYFNITPNIKCENGANKVTKAISALQGVDSVKPDLATQTMMVLYDPNTLKPEIIVNAMAEIGYQITPKVDAKAARVTAATTATAVPNQRQAAEAFQRIENANPGPVIAIDGKPVLHQCQNGNNGKCQNENNGQCQNGNHGQCQNENNGQCQNGNNGQCQNRNHGQCQNGNHGQCQNGNHGQCQNENNGQCQNGNHSQCQNGNNGQCQNGNHQNSTCTQATSCEQTGATCTKTPKPTKKSKKNKK